MPPMISTLGREAKSVAIVPTLGRVMWFVAGEDFKHHNGFQVHKDQRYRCDVLEDGSETSALVGVTDRNANSFAFSVPVRQPDAPAPKGDYVEWMPFQVGQASKGDSEIKALRDEIAALRVACTPVAPDVTHTHLTADLDRASDEGMTAQFSEDDDDDDKYGLSTSPDDTDIIHDLHNGAENSGG